MRVVGKGAYEHSHGLTEGEDVGMLLVDGESLDDLNTYILLSSCF
jgi:hypothetical protein